MQPQTTVNTSQKPKRPKEFKITLVVAAALWLIACLLVAYQDPAKAWSMPGLACFLWGPFALLDLQFAGFVAWLSNVLVFVAVLLLLTRKYHRAVIFSAIAVAFSFASFFVTTLPMNEGTSNRAHVSVGPAVFTWIASVVVVLVGSIILDKAAKTNARP